MNKNTTRYTALLLAAILAALPLSAKKKTAAIAVPQGIAVSNQSVEPLAGRVTVGMDISLDSLTLRSRTRIILTPSLRGEGTEAQMPQIVINGRRQNIEYKRFSHKDYAKETTVVRRYNKTAQSLRYTAELPLEDWMRNADLVLVGDYCGCGDTLGSLVVPVKCLRTPLLEYVRPEARPKAYELAGSAYIDFPVDETILYPEYRRNPEELKKIVDTINKVKDDPNATITQIEIKGWASPESPYEHNAYLAENRAKTLKDYVRSLLSLSDTVFTVSFVPENWQGLRECVLASESLANKDAILALIDKEMDPDAKEARIKSLYPADYTYMLGQFYPGLRRSDYRVAYTIRPFTVDEAREMLKTDPGHLSMEEMYLVAQEYEPGTDEFNDVFATAVRLFPDDPVADLNAACAEMEHGDLDAAGRHLEKAGDSPQALNARGVLAYRRGNVEEARELYRRAAEAGCAAAQDNLRNLERHY
ncbi:MAG: DUF3868 domain-containing protein [Prevotellaceae bacterium]|nr:DUF3868 domain-containing protein [Prevotellaceae bacterium]